MPFVMRDACSVRLFDVPRQRCPVVVAGSASGYRGSDRDAVMLVERVTYPRCSLSRSIEELPAWVQVYISVRLLWAAHFKVRRFRCEGRRPGGVLRRELRRVVWRGKSSTQR